MGWMVEMGKIPMLTTYECSRHRDGCFNNILWTENVTTSNVGLIVLDLSLADVRHPCLCGFQALPYYEVQFPSRNYDLMLM